MKLKSYNIVSDCIEAAIERGMNRAYKHTDEGQHPARHAITEAVHNAIMLDLSEIINFDDDKLEENTP